ncbi:MAG: hypothetical protein ACI8W3_001910 [Myxococcota bacterium]|jgi:hypothetical protein
MRCRRTEQKIVALGVSQVFGGEGDKQRRGLERDTVPQQTSRVKAGTAQNTGEGVGAGAPDLFDARFAFPIDVVVVF